MQPIETQQKIVDLLNKLIELQPELASKLFQAGIPANEAVQAWDGYFTRTTIAGEYVTLTGIIAAIDAAINPGAKTCIASLYEDGIKLTGFGVRELALIPKFAGGEMDTEENTSGDSTNAN